MMVLLVGLPGICDKSCKPHSSQREEGSGRTTAIELSP